MRIIGFDPGTFITGYGVVEEDEGEVKYIESGIIDVRKFSDLQKKLSFIYDRAVELGKKFEVSSFAVEDVFVAKNTKSTLKLGYVKGVIFLAGEHLNLKVYEYSPTAVKQAITGFGRSTKEEIRRMLPNIVKNFKESEYFDATDALAIAYCHFANLR